MAESSDVHEKRFAPDLIRRAQALERTLDAEQKFLSPEHRVTHYLQSRIAHLFPNIPLTVRVAEREQEPNALSLPNGTIVVTKGLLRLLDTQDEIDFVLGHEGQHFLQGHVQEIQDVQQVLQKKYQKNANVVAAGVRLLGTTRFAEYEADIRGIVTITKGRVNPNAARSALTKLERYYEDKRAGQPNIAHGKNIARMVNIAFLAALFDADVTKDEQVPLPLWLKEYAETPDESLLFERILEANVVPEISADSKDRTLTELLLTLRESRNHDRLIADDPHARRAHENIAFFQKHVTERLQQEVARTMPRASVKKRAQVLHMLLATTTGISLKDALDTPFESATGSFDQLKTKKDFEDVLDVFTPKLCEQLKLVIPEHQDLLTYVYDLIRAANERELFLDANGVFDTRAYVTFCKNVLEKSKHISASGALSKEDDSEASSSNVIFEEGLLNLQLEKSPHSVIDLMEEMRNAGIPLNTTYIVHTLDSLPERQKKRLPQTELDAYFKAHDRYYQIQKQVERILDISPQAWQTAAAAEDRMTTRWFEGSPLSKRIPEAIATLAKNLPLKTTEDFQASLTWLRTYFSQYNITRQNAFGHTIIDINVEEDVLEKLREHLLKDPSVTFLPRQETDRDLFLFFQLYANEGQASPLMTKQLEHVTSRLSTKLDTGELHVKRFEHFFTLLHIIDGTHPWYKDLRKTPLFRPLRAHVSSASEDNVLLTQVADVGFSELSRWISSTDKPSKKEVAQELHQMEEALFAHVDRLPIAPERNLAETIAAAYPFDIHDPEDQELLLDLSCVITNEDKRLRLQDRILSMMTAHTTFDDKVRLLFKDKRLKNSVTRTTRDRFIEVDTQQPMEFKQVETALEEHLSTFASAEYIGVSVMAELATSLLGTSYSPRLKRRLFQILMDTSLSEEKLRANLLNLEMRGEDQYPLHESMQYVDFQMESIFAVDDLTRYAVTRELLIGEHGLLEQEESRLWLLRYLFQQHVNKPNTEEETRLFTLVKEMLEAAVKETDTDLLFFMLAPLIQERVLRRPAQYTPWETVLKERFHNFSQEEREEILRKYHRDHTRVPQKTQSMGGETDEDKDDEEERSSSRYEQMDGAKILNDIIGQAQHPSTQEKRMGIEQFITRIAESFGAPGVRFLQILGQYMEVPPSLQETFRNAYDNVKRQSKLTSAHTIRREWPTVEQEVARLKERRGGGSLMTSYEADMTDGSKRIIKVLNANTRLFVNESIRALRKTFTKLSQTQPERYRIALLALDEIEKWILEDIDYTRFHETDPLFKSVNHGFTAPGHDYQIYVPQSFSIEKDGKDNPYVKTEEFIEGSTLVRLEELPEHDHKQIASLLVKNFMHQIVSPVTVMRGEPPHPVEVSLVHADVHPGNFMVFHHTDGKPRIAIIDRNNYLELTAEDRALCLSLLSADNMEQAMDQLVAYLLTISAHTVPEEDREQIHEEVLEAIHAKPGTLMDAVPTALVSLKRRGIITPLRITLLMKNLQGLNRFSKDAGFAGIAEAFTYMPSSASAPNPFTPNHS